MTDDNIAAEIIRLLGLAKDRSEVMAKVGDEYCLLCWKKLDGNCYCAPAYDE